MAENETRVQYGEPAYTDPIPEEVLARHRHVRVMERHTPNCNWAYSRGLQDIPLELAAETRATVAQMNARFGWNKYMVY